MGCEVVTGGRLYVVATPIGNLEDITGRAVEVLRSVDLVAAEDTRRSRKLLQAIGAHPRLLSFHAHSPEGRVNRIVERLRGGARVALVSDAGTPVVSDPGARLVQAAREAGVAVVTIPGPSAVQAALSVSGLPADRYTFLGFLPRRGKERQILLDYVKHARWTVVIFESPNRLVRLLDDLMANAGGERQARVTRELTKVHEEVRAGTLSELRVYYDGEDVRGEITLLVAGAAAEQADVPAVDEQVIREMALSLLNDGFSRRDAATRIAGTLGVSRRDVYRIVTGVE